MNSALLLTGRVPKQITADSLLLWNGRPTAFAFLSLRYRLGVGVEELRVEAVGTEGKGRGVR